MSQLSFDFEATTAVPMFNSQAEEVEFLTQQDKIEGKELTLEAEIHIGVFLMENYEHKSRIYSSSEVRPHYLEQAICIAAYSTGENTIHEPSTGKYIIAVNDDAYVILDSAATELLNKHLAKAKEIADRQAKFEAAKAEAMENNMPFKAATIQMAEDMQAMVKANQDGLHFDELKGLLYTTFKNRAKAIDMPERTYRAVIGFILGLTDGSEKLPYRSDKAPVPLPR